MEQNKNQLRRVTVLYPRKNEDCNILDVSVSGDIEDTRIGIELKDGKVFSLDENTNVCEIGI